MLVLPIKKQWFDMIRSGEKKEEYREIKPYWTKRFNNILNKHLTVPRNVEKDCREFSQCIIIYLRNGYSSFSPMLKCACKLRIGQGKQEWGAEQGKEYYILEILEILEVQNEKN